MAIDESGAPQAVALGTFVLDLRRHALMTLEGGLVELRPQSIELLCYLAVRSGQIVTKRELLQQLWPGMVVTEDSLVQAVSDARRVIGDERHDIIQTVPRRGYRLVASATVTPGEQRMAPAPNPGPASHRLRWLGLGALTVALAGSLAAWQPWRPSFNASGQAAPDRPPMAVINLADPGASSEDQELSHAYAYELIGDLSRNADLSVIAGHSSLRLGSGNEPPRRIAQQLGARYLVNVSLHREATQLRLRAELIDGRSDRVIWTERQDLAAAEVYQKRAALVQRIAGSVHSSIRGNEEAAALQRPPSSLDVYAMTLRAIALKHRLNPQAIAESRELLKQVTAMDPTYAPGWLYLGMVNGIDATNVMTVRNAAQRREMLELAAVQVERSIELNPRLPPAYLALTFIYPALGRYDDGVRAGRRCMELGPSDAECMIFLAAYLANDEQHEEALPLARRAMAMSPRAPAYVQRFYGHVLWANRLLEEALAALDECVQEVPSYLACRIDRAVARVEAGKIDEARADAIEWQRAAATIGMTLEQYAQANGGLDPEKAHALIERRVAAVRQLALPEVASGR